MREETLDEKIALLPQRVAELIQEIADLRALTEGLAIAINALNDTISAFAQQRDEGGTA